MDIGKAFEVAFNRKKEKNWEKIYVVVDIHDTILRACYENEETYSYYPYAREALQLMTNRDDICMILWSGCYDEQMTGVRAYNGFFTTTVAVDYLYGLGGVIIGTMLGAYVFKHIPNRIFRYIVYAYICISGFTILITN